MVIFWKDKVAKINNRFYKYRTEVITAGRFKQWDVVATRNKMFFYGKEDFTIPILIYTVVLTKENIYVHKIEDCGVYKLNGPLDEEMFLFFSPTYILYGVYLTGDIFDGNREVFILKNEKDFLLKSDKMYKIDFKITENAIEYKYTVFTVEDFIGIKNGNKIYNFYSLSSLDEKLQQLSCTENTNNRIIVFDDSIYAFYEEFVVILDHRNTKDYEHSTKRNKNSYQSFLRCDKKIETYRMIRQFLSRDRSLNFLQVENFLIFNGEVLVNNLNVNDLSNLYQDYSHSQDYYEPFWKKLTRLDCKIFETLNNYQLKEIFIHCINKEEVHFHNLRLEDTTLRKINTILMSKLYKYGDIKRFFICNSKYVFLGKIEIFENLQKILSKESHFINSDDYNEVLDTKYSRIFNYNKSFMSNFNIKKCKNLAALVIHIEETFKNGSKFKLYKNWKNYARRFFRHFKDTRMEEVYSILNEKPKVFEIGDNDIENKKERAYAHRLSTNIGKAYTFFNSFKATKIQEVKPLVLPLQKDTQFLNMDSKEKGLLKWASFNYSASRFIVSGNNFIMTMDNKIKSILETLSNTQESEYLYAGSIFAYGLQKRFKSIEIEMLEKMLIESYDVLSMSILVAFGLSNISMPNDHFFKFFSRKMNSDVPFLTRVGLIISVGLVFANSYDNFAKELLYKEINRMGTMQSEKNNKNNTIFYDTTYRITSTFSLALVLNGISIKKYDWIKTDDKLCEIILNGIVLFESRNIKYLKFFERFKEDPLEEMFYSQFFTCGLNFGTNYTEILDEILSNMGGYDIHDLYGAAGKIFYIGVSFITKGIAFSECIVKKMFRLCLESEESMIKNEKYSIFFDYTLISLSIILNSSCDLELIRIIRRQIKKSERPVCLNESQHFVFTSTGLNSEIQYFRTIGDIEKYKICLGFVTMGLTRVKLSASKNALVYLIATFYVDYPVIMSDQEYFNIFRYFSLLGLDENNKCPITRSLKFSFDDKKIRFKKYFKQKFEALDEYNQKFVVDILSDFFEKNPRDTFSIDIDYLKRKICKCR